MEWVTISFTRGSSQPRDQTHISCIGRQILYHWATREAPHKQVSQSIIKKRPSASIRMFVWEFSDKAPVQYRADRAPSVKDKEVGLGVRGLAVRWSQVCKVECSLGALEYELWRKAVGDGTTAVVLDGGWRDREKGKRFYYPRDFLQCLETF